MTNDYMEDEYTYLQIKNLQRNIEKITLALI